MVGGYPDTKQTLSRSSETVELVSLDPINYPVPDQFKRLKKFPIELPYKAVGGALFSQG